MTDLPHLRLQGTAQDVPYVAVGGGGGAGEFRAPPRDRQLHATRLRSALEAASVEAIQERQGQGLDPAAEGDVFTVRSRSGFELQFDSLERRASRIELLSVSVEDGVTAARVFVPRGKLPILLGLIDAYATKQSEKGKPRNRDLIESIESIGLAAVRDFWVDVADLFPAEDESIWWEVWLRKSGETGQLVHTRFSARATELGLRVSDERVEFPERTVVLAFGSQRQLSRSLDVLFSIAELRRAKELPSTFLDLTPSEQADVIRELEFRVVPPAANAPAVCLLDTGVNRAHPLLSLALTNEDTQSVKLAEWGSADHSREQHGTGMAGIALYGCLTSVLGTGGPVTLRHRLESVKLLPPPPGRNDERDYGPYTMQAVALAEIQAPKRNRAICMAVTADDRDLGLPSLWSATVDGICAGADDETRRLFFVSAGNVQTIYEPSYAYFRSNRELGVEDPAQSWNAVTVGAYTEKVSIRDPTFRGWEPIAKSGDLCPTSRTSLNWPDENQKGWPIKPDVVMEGGNYAQREAEISNCPDLSLLTTSLPTGRSALLNTVQDTSPATAAAARMSAMIWSRYPSLTPETIRGLLVHSAEWTDEMVRRFPGPAKASIQRRLRCYGYGVPQLRKALWSAENSATLVFEGEIQPYEKVGSDIRSNAMHLHRLPWPVDVLEELGATDVTMRVTLSYFVEPSPGRIGWTKKHRYQSHGLRFDVLRPTESELAFRQRLSRAEWDAPDDRPDNATETRNWIIGEHGRTRGSLHSDWWTGTATELASCGMIAVYPVTGWWRERAHLGRWGKRAQYSLIVTLETPDTTVDLYTPIVNMTSIATEIETDTD